MKSGHHHLENETQNNTQNKVNLGNIAAAAKFKTMSREQSQQGIGNPSIGFDAMSHHSVGQNGPNVPDHVKQFVEHTSQMHAAGANGPPQVPPATRPRSERNRLRSSHSTHSNNGVLGPHGPASRSNSRGQSLRNTGHPHLTQQDLSLVLPNNNRISDQELLNRDPKTLSEEDRNRLNNLQMSLANRSASMRIQQANKPNMTSLPNRSGGVDEEEISFRHS